MKDLNKAMKEFADILSRKCDEYNIPDDEVIKLRIYRNDGFIAAYIGPHLFNYRYKEVENNEQS